MMPPDWRPAVGVRHRDECLPILRRVCRYRRTRLLGGRRGPPKRLNGATEARTLIGGSGERAMKAHILLVEDNPGVLMATSLLLTGAGYRVTTATTVAEASDRTRNNPDLDLVITDYRLCGEDTGRKVIAAVRELRGLAFNAIVISGDTSSAV